MTGRLYDELITATERASERKVAQLLAAGADMTANEGRPIETATKTGNLEVFQAYLDHGAGKHLRPEWFTSVLSSRVANRVKVAAMMLDAGLQLGDQPEALLLAVENGDAWLIEATLKAGASVHQQPVDVMLSLLANDGLSPEETVRLVDELLAREFMDEGSQFACLHAALTYGVLDGYAIATKVLDSGVDLYDRDFMHFQRAVNRGDAARLRFMVERCAMAGPDGRLLPWRDWHPDPELEQLLIEAELSASLSMRIESSGDPHDVSTLPSL